MERIDSTCSLAIFSKSRPKRYGADEVKRSMSSTNGRRSLFRWPTILFLLSEETLACAFPRKRTAWVTASTAESGVRQPARCCSSTWARGPTVSRRRACSQPRLRSASFASFGIWGGSWCPALAILCRPVPACHKSFSTFAKWRWQQASRRPRSAARQCLSTLCEGRSRRSRRCQRSRLRRYCRFHRRPHRATPVGPEGEVRSAAYRPTALVAGRGRLGS